MLGNSCVTAQLAASQEGLSSMKLVNDNFTDLHYLQGHISMKCG
jgi:hypothetical protein